MKKTALIFLLAVLFSACKKKDEVVPEPEWTAVENLPYDNRIIINSTLHNQVLYFVGRNILFMDRFNRYLFINKLNEYDFYADVQHVINMNYTLSTLDDKLIISRVDEDNGSNYVTVYKDLSERADFQRFSFMRFSLAPRLSSVVNQSDQILTYYLNNDNNYVLYKLDLKPNSNWIADREIIEDSIYPLAQSYTQNEYDFPILFGHKNYFLIKDKNAILKIENNGVIKEVKNLTSKISSFFLLGNTIYAVGYDCFFQSIDDGESWTTIDLNTGSLDTFHYAFLNVDGMIIATYKNKFYLVEFTGIGSDLDITFREFKNNGLPEMVITSILFDHDKCYISGTGGVYNIPKDLFFRFK